LAGRHDVAQVAREGYSACVCKATEGVGYQDPKFDRDIPLIQASGMIPGAYHFLRDGDGAAQARAFLTRVAQYGGPDGWLIQLDCESDGYGPEMTAWAAEWNRLTGNHPFLIYSGAWWWPRTNGFRGVDLTPHVWHSHYVPGTGYGSTLYEQVPASGWKPGYGGWNEATILQFSDAGRVAGARLDVNAFRGTVEQLRALARTPIAPKPSPPARSWTKELIMELPVLRRGAKGSQVTVLQGLLNARGQKLAEDGDYGPRTEAAVKAEQREGHIGVDGVAGQHTYSVLLLGRDIF
jgi:lysozyme